MGVVVGLLLGLGVFFVWWSCWVPAPARPRSPGGWHDRAMDTMNQAGMELVSLRTLAVTCLGLGCMVFAAAWAMSGVVPIAACFALMATWAPVAVIRGRARRRRQRLRDVWPEVVDNLASGVRAGLSLPEALAQIADRGPEPLRPAFATFAADYRTSGRFGDALDALKERLADPVADRICEALRITREVGGTDLGRLLRSLSAVLREDARTRAELQARQSWTVNAARLAVAAPWAVLAILATRPESVRAYNSRSGVVVLVVGAGLSIIAYRLMLRLARLPEEQRVLR
jgi:tight adherence protein B